ncbi:MAG TPA: hypothetical protein VH593_05505 [Ktedonobacteraceae bacterium]
MRSLDRIGRAYVLYAYIALVTEAWLLPVSISYLSAKFERAREGTDEQVCQAIHDLVAIGVIEANDHEVTRWYEREWSDIPKLLEQRLVTAKMEGVR